MQGYLWFVIFLKTGGRSFSYQAPLLWNRLPVWVQTLDLTAVTDNITVNGHPVTIIPATIVQSKFVLSSLLMLLLILLNSLSALSKLPNELCCNFCCSIHPLAVAIPITKGQKEFLHADIVAFNNPNKHFLWRIDPKK